MRKDIPGEPSICYGKLLTGLTGHRKPPKMATIQPFCAWQDPGSNPRGGCVWGENVEPGGSGSPFVSSYRHLVNSVDWVHDVHQLEALGDRAGGLPEWLFFAAIEFHDRGRAMRRAALMVLRAPPLSLSSVGDVAVHDDQGGPVGGALENLQRAFQHV